MMDTRDFQLVQETLSKEWSKLEPLQLNQKDLTAGIKLLTNIALAELNPPPSPKQLTPGKKLTLKVELVPVADKIKAFVKNKAHHFREVCQTGFPFSLLEHSSAEDALKLSLENHFRSILSDCMQLKSFDWMNVKDLDKYFGLAVQQMTVKEIVNACSDLMRTYHKGKTKSGYYLLWLIQRTTGCDYQIPKKNSFNHLTVTKVLSQFFKGSLSLSQKTIFLEILLYRRIKSEAFSFQGLLDQRSRHRFFNFIIEQLQNIPMDHWQSKANIISTFFEIARDKVRIATDLSSSQDPATARIGGHFSGALTANSFREAIPHFHALIKILPDFSYTHIKSIFGCPFIEFRENGFYHKNPGFTKRLHFNKFDYGNGVFVYDSLMIGEYDSRPDSPPYLLAYDMHTEELVWGIPLTPTALNDSFLNETSIPKSFDTLQSKDVSYRLRKVGEHLTLHFIQEKMVHFIHAKTGECDFTLSLLKISDNLHISPEGFAYHKEYKSFEEKDSTSGFIGAKILNNQWTPSFEREAPPGRFRPLSTHCGFENPVKNQLILFGPTGDQVIIPHYIQARAQENKLYAIEKDPVNKKKCLLTLRTLKTDQEVVSQVETAISLNVSEASFGNLCHNGLLVLFAQNPDSSIFIDLHSQQVTYNDYTLSPSAKHIVNLENGDIWTWNETSKQVWKISADHILTLMGTLDSGLGTILLHIDKKEQLYFAQI